MFFIISFLPLEGSSSKKKTRGSTCNLDLLGMKPDEKKSTQFNTKGQIIYHDKGERFLVIRGVGTISTQCTHLSPRLASH